MSIYKKIAEARVKLQETKLTKSGFNKFANFKYYELADFLPSLNKINLELGICTKFELDTEGKKAILNIFDFDKPEEKIIFDIPYVPSKVQGATEIQNLGGTITYLRRYLFLVAFEITDGDVIDAQDLDKPKAPEENKLQKDKLATQNQLSKIFATAGELKIGKSDLECVIFKDYNVKSMKDLTIAQANKIIENIKTIAEGIEKRKEECIKAITALEMDEELITIMERDNIKNLPDSTFTVCKKVYKELKAIKELQQNTDIEKQKGKENKPEEVKGEEK